MALDLTAYDRVPVQDPAGPVCPALDCLDLRLGPLQLAKGTIHGGCNYWLPKDWPNLLWWDRGELSISTRPDPVGRTLRSPGGWVRLSLEGQLWRETFTVEHFTALRAVLAGWLRAANVDGAGVGVSISRADYGVSVACDPFLSSKALRPVLGEIEQVGARIGCWPAGEPRFQAKRDGWTWYLEDSEKARSGRCVVRCYHPEGQPWLRVEVESRRLSEPRASRALLGLVEVLTLADQLREAQLRSQELISAALGGAPVVWQAGTDQLRGAPELPGVQVGRRSTLLEMALRTYGMAWGTAAKAGLELPEELDHTFRWWVQALCPEAKEPLKKSRARAEDRLRKLTVPPPDPEVVSFLEAADQLLRAARPASEEVELAGGWQ